MMLKLQCFITGDQYNNVKNETPESIKKIKLSAMVIFIPVFLWLTEGFIIMTELFNSTLIQAIIATVIISILVFMLERSISMMKGGKLIFVTRFMLGILIALLGALTMDEVIFKTDVDKQLEENHRNYVSEEIIKWESDNMSKIDIQSIITGESTTIAENSLKIYLDEINGTGGSGRRGVDIVAKEKQKIYSDALDNYKNEKLKLDQMRSEFENDKAVFKTKMESSLPEGLLHRIEAMFDLIYKSPVMAVFCGIFTLILLILDLMVVIVKISSSKTNYERKNEEIEIIGESRMMRMRLKDSEHFSPSDMHPGVVRMRRRMNSEKPQLF